MLNPILFYIDDMAIIESDDMNGFFEYLKNSDIKNAIINDLKDHVLKSYENQSMSSLTEYGYVTDDEGCIFISDNYIVYQLNFSKGHIVKAYKYIKGLIFIDTPKVIYDVISPIKIKFEENN